MTPTWKLKQSEAEVDRFLERVTRVDPSLPGQRPRAVEHLLSATFDVAIERCPTLTLHVVAETLARLGISDPDLGTVDAQPLAGFVFGRGDDVVVFTSTAFGPESERFTLAHEAGHLVLEHLPRLDARGQGNLFGDELVPAVLAARDPPSHLFGGDDIAARSAKGSTQDPAQWLREVKANAFAAELLAPYREVQRVAGPLKSDAERVDAVRARFALSRRAAEIRLSEVGLVRQQAQGLLLDP